MKIEEVVKQNSFVSPQIKAFINLIYTSGYIQQKLARFFRKQQISIQQYNVLRILRGQKGKPIRLVDVTARMIDKMSNTARLVEKLRAKGYLNRTVNPTNKREVSISITETGLDFIKSIEKEVDEITMSCIYLNSEDSEALSDLLDKLRG